MCFDTDSEPPIPHISGAAVSHDDLVLEAPDGNRFAAFRALAGSVGGRAANARPEDRGAGGAAEPDDGPAATGIVILPDVRGLYRFYEELALRFAERGYAAIAFDYFGRTAGVEKRDDDFDYMPHVQETTAAGVQADVGTCVRHLTALGCSSIFTVGFCFGGRNSWIAAASGHGLAGAVGFYGSLGDRANGDPGPPAYADRMECPILALQAGDDQNITHEMNLAFERALSEAGVEHELVEYEGAPHSFFDRKQEEFAEASDDAWRRVLAFVAAHA